MIVTNTWNIVMAVFDVAQNVVSQSAGVIILDAGIDISGVVGDLETQLADWSVGALLALGFQAFLIMICVGIYAVLVEGISTSGDNISAAIWGCMGYTVLLCYTLFNTGSLAKSLFGAH